MSYGVNVRVWVGLWYGCVHVVRVGIRVLRMVGNVEYDWYMVGVCDQVEYWVGFRGGLGYSRVCKRVIWVG